MSFNIGDTRIVRRFMFRKVTVSGHTRWLEFARLKQVYIGRSFGWINIAFVDKRGDET